MSLERDVQEDQEAPGIFLSLSAHAASSSVPVSSSSLASDSAMPSDSASVPALDFPPLPSSSSPSSQLCFGAFPSVSAEASFPREAMVQKRVDIETSLSLQQPFHAGDSQRTSYERDSQRTCPEREHQRISCKQDSQRTFAEHEYQRNFAAEEICHEQDSKRMFPPEKESHKNSPELLTKPESHRNHNEQESQRSFLQQEPQSFFPEQESQRSFLEQEPRRFFPEQEPQRLFPEQEPPRLFPEQEPPSLFPQQEPQRFFPEQEPQRFFPEQEPQRSLSECGSQILVTERENRRFHPEKASQEISSEQEPESRSCGEGYYGISSEGEPGKAFPVREPNRISVEQEPQTVSPEQQCHIISSQSLQNPAILSQGDLSNHQTSPSSEGLGSKRKSFPFEEGQEPIPSEQQKNECFLGFLNQSDDKPLQRSPKRQNTGILLENLKFSSSFQEVSSSEEPSQKPIMASLQLGQGPVEEDSRQQSPEKLPDSQVSPLSLFHSRDKEKVTSPVLDSAQELKAPCMLASSLDVREESAIETSVESMPSTRHILPLGLLHSPGKENSSVREECSDHQKSASAQTNSMKESKDSCVPMSSIQARLDSGEGTSAEAMSLDQSFLPSSFVRLSDMDNIASFQRSLEHQKSTFRETHSMKETETSCAHTNSIQPRSDSVLEASTEPLPLNQTQLPPGRTLSHNKEKDMSIQSPLRHHTSAFSQPEPTKELKASCLLASSIETSSGVVQDVKFPINNQPESCLVSSEQSKHTLGHLFGSVSQPTPSCLQDKSAVLISEPIVAATRIGKGNTLKETDSSVSLHCQDISSGAHHGSKQVYPAALATHSEVIENQNLFRETFEKFQSSLGLHVEIPKIAGEDLDLHKLYKQVTNRGGFVKVSKERKWKEVMQAFNISSSGTEASSVLRKIYSSTLHHYEQVYFFGVNGQIVQCPEHLVRREKDAKSSQQSLDNLQSIQHRTSGTIDSAQALGVDPASSIGTMVKGTIDGKFDNGYLVTVMVGTRKMRGVLYHVAPTNTAPQSAIVPGMMQMIGGQPKSTDLAPTVGRKKKKPEVIRKDPNAPRQNRSGYNFFFAEQRARLKTMQPDKDKAISKMIGELWNNLTEDEKYPYQAQGIKDKERYICEMKEYKERAKLPMVGFSSLNMASSQGTPVYASSRAKSNNSVFRGHPNDSKLAASSHISSSALILVDSSGASQGSSKSESTMDLKNVTQS